MNLTIFKFVQLGDNVVFLPVVQALRAQFPDWRITLLTTPREAALYESMLPAGDVLTAAQLRFNSSWHRPWELAMWWSRIRSRQPDACLVSFDQSNTAHLLAGLSGARLRIGARVPHVKVRGSLTHDVPLPADGCVPSWHWEMARVLAAAHGVTTWPKSPPPPDLTHLVTPAEPSPRPRIVIHAGSNQAITRWPIERFAQVAARLAETAEVIWIEHGETAGAVLAPTIRRFASPGIRELVNLLATADLFLGNNSGPMHLANALGRPGVVVTGPTAFGWNPYWYRDRWRVLRHPSLACAPCEMVDRFERRCRLIDDPLACLRYWSVEAVESACRERLARATPP